MTSAKCYWELGDLCTCRWPLVKAFVLGHPTEEGRKQVRVTATEPKEDSLLFNYYHGQVSYCVRFLTT